ncbi:MAG: hypothetical protein FRX48_08365 [Lasallia pustulata]|uniref:Uncharacterized protein n=1 Tax=Lasallia pustulata TaxID=136370 RepID=A0A5M8PGW8_9LECA|nr:MAG: hypothetical protein FRX48_08365 [Lasallia pustulata]
MKFSEAIENMLDDQETVDRVTRVQRSKPLPGYKLRHFMKKSDGPLRRELRAGLQRLVVDGKFPNIEGYASLAENSYAFDEDIQLAIQSHQLQSRGDVRKGY